MKEYHLIDVYDYFYDDKIPLTETRRIKVLALLNVALCDDAGRSLSITQVRKKRHFDRRLQAMLHEKQKTIKYVTRYVETTHGMIQCTTGQLISQVRFRNIIHKTTGIEIRQMPSNLWDICAQMLLEVSQDEMDNGGDRG